MFDRLPHLPEPTPQRRSSTRLGHYKPQARLLVDGSRLPAGLCVGSELLDDAEELTTVTRVGRDGNATRFAFYLALWALCLGSDLQLLYDLAKHDQVWSIDHGLWFDSLEGDWTPEHLAIRADDPWPWPPDIDVKALDPEALRGDADAVEGLTCADLAEVMGRVPLVPRQERLWS